MILNRKSKNLIYSLLYLLPIVIFSVYVFFFSNISESVLYSIDTTRPLDLVLNDLNFSFKNYFSMFIESFCSPIITLVDEFGDLAMFPISNILNYIFNDIFYSYGGWYFFYGLNFYLDYCLYVTIALISFEVLTILPSICRKFLHKLSD